MLKFLPRVEKIQKSHIPFSKLCLWYRPNAEAVRKRLAAGLVSDKDSNIQDSLDAFKIKIEDFETRLKRTSDENSQLLQTLIEAVKESRNNNQAKHISASKVDKSKESGQKLAENHKNNENSVQKSSSSLVIAVLMFACNRVTVSKALDSLLTYRKDKAKFPIIGMTKFEQKTLIERFL